MLARYAADRNAPAFAALAYRVIRRGAALGLVGVGVALLLGRSLLQAAYGPSYAAESDAFVFVAVSGALHFVMVPAIFPLTAARALLVQPVIYGAAIVAAGTASAVLIPQHGLVGAALAGVAGMATGSACALLLLRRTVTSLARGHGASA